MEISYLMKNMAPYYIIIIKNFIFIQDLKGWGGILISNKFNYIQI